MAGRNSGNQSNSDTQRVLPSLPGHVCTICAEPTLIAENPLVTCSVCKVRVHLWCYDPKEDIAQYTRTSPPPKPWKCQACKAGAVMPVTCAMCHHIGGAMKPTTSGEWVHSVCMLWIPDVEIADRESGSGVMLSTLTNDRIKLKCSLCNTRGACIQCYAKKCMTAFHPWCMLKVGMGKVLRRLVPVVPTQPNGPVRYLCYCHLHHLPTYTGLPTRLGPSNPQQACTQFGLILGAGKRLPSQLDADLDAISARLHHNNRQTLAIAAGNEALGEVQEEVAGGGLQDEPLNMPLLMDFPGIQAGLDMDLDYYWRVVNAYFVEYQGLPQLERLLAEILPPPADEYPAMQIPQLGTLPAAARASRSTAVNSSWDAASVGGSSDASGAEEDSYDATKSKESKGKDNRLTRRNSGGLTAGAPYAVRSVVRDVVGDGKVTVKFDHEGAVVGAQFALKKALGSSDVAPEGEKVDWQLWRPADTVATPDSSGFIEAGDAVNRCPAVPSTNVHGRVVDDNIPPGGVLTTLQGFTCLDCHHSHHDTAAPQAGGSAGAEPNPAHDTGDGEILMELRQLQRRLGAIDTQNMVVMQPMINKLRAVATAEDEKSQSANEKLARSKAVRIWKRLASHTLKGVKDQRPGFNTVPTEEVAASWMLVVEGREKKKEEDEGEDVICSVCFQGIDTDLDQVVVCDNCNMGVHQSCYGIEEVTDEFYCDRCVLLRRQQARDSTQLQQYQSEIKCVLCTTYHGGLKKTTQNGYYVHLACAMTTPGTVIEDLENMGPVNITQVLEKAKEADDKATAVQDFVGCGLCRKREGYIFTCAAPCCNERNGRPERFHFLCAWFAGCKMTCELKDPSFGARPTEMPTFPHGLEVKILCKTHSAVGRSMAIQSEIRNKYKLNPAHDMGKAKTPAKVARAGGTGRGRGRPPSVPAANHNYIVPVAAPAPIARAPTTGPLPLPIDDTSWLVCSVCMLPPGNILGSAAPTNGGDIVECVLCHVRVHTACYGPGGTYAEGGNTGGWLCGPCSAGAVSAPGEGLFCYLCPRRGGAMRATTDKTPKYVHAYCADHLPEVYVGDELTGRDAVEKSLVPSDGGGSSTSGRPFLVNIKGITKEMKQHKCALCGSKKGTGYFCKCSHPGCEDHFHPLCARNCGLYSRRFTPEEQVSHGRFKYAHYCKLHTPVGVYHLTSKHSVDFHATQKLYSDNDKARLIVDQLRRYHHKRKRECDAVLEQFDTCREHLSIAILDRKSELIGVEAAAEARAKETAAANERIAAILAGVQTDDGASMEEIKAVSATPRSVVAVFGKKRKMSRTDGGTSAWVGHEYDLYTPLDEVEDRKRREDDALRQATAERQKTAQLKQREKAADALRAAHAPPTWEGVWGGIKQLKEDSQLPSFEPIDFETVLKASGANIKAKEAKVEPAPPVEEASSAAVETVLAAPPADDPVAVEPVPTAVHAADEPTASGEHVGEGGVPEARNPRAKTVTAQAADDAAADKDTPAQAEPAHTDSVAEKAAAPANDVHCNGGSSDAGGMVNGTHKGKGKGKKGKGRVVVNGDTSAQANGEVAQGAREEQPMLPLPPPPPVPSYLNNRSKSEVLLDRQLWEVFHGFTSHRVPRDPDYTVRPGDGYSAEDNKRLLTATFELAGLVPNDVFYKIQRCQYNNLDECVKDLRALADKLKAKTANSADDVKSLKNLCDTLKSQVIKGADNKQEAVGAGIADMELATQKALDESKSSGKRVRLPTEAGVSSSKSTAKKSTPAKASKNAGDHGGCAVCGSPPELSSKKKGKPEPHWYCAKCIAQHHDKFIGCRVLVGSWSGLAGLADAGGSAPDIQPSDAWAPAVVQAFEPISGKHRLVLDTGKWSFGLLASQKLRWQSPTPLDVIKKKKRNADDPNKSNKRPRASPTEEGEQKPPPLLIPLPTPSTESNGQGKGKGKRARESEAAPSLGVDMNGTAVEEKPVAALSSPAKKKGRPKKVVESVKVPDEKESSEAVPIPMPSPRGRPKKSAKAADKISSVADIAPSTASSAAGGKSKKMKIEGSVGEHPASSVAAMPQVNDVDTVKKEAGGRKTRNSLDSLVVPEDDVPKKRGRPKGS